MKPITMAQANASETDVDALWDQVDSVERLADGTDLYIYPDGSKLKVSETDRVVL